MDQDLALTSPQLAKLIGIEPRMTTIWAERGYLRPTLQEADGRGSKRLWSREDAVFALMVKELIGPLSPGILRTLAKVVSTGKLILQRDVIWMLPLGGNEKTIARFYKGKDLEPLGRLEYSELPSGHGEQFLLSLDGCKPISEETGPILMTINLGMLHEALDERLRKGV